MAEKTVCSSCKRNVANLRAARFSCPKCSKSEVIRCSGCRANAVSYSCASCGFTGPN